MGRPPLPVGTAGEIRTYAVRGRFRARCLVRDLDGEVREMERWGRSASAAVARLREAVRDRRVLDAGATVTAETPLADVVALWLVELRADVAAGAKSPGTGELYETTADRVVKGLGKLRLREVTVGRVDRFIAATQEQHGPVSAKRVKTVLNGVLGLAARHDAISSNPVRDTRRIRHGEKRSAVALDVAQVHALRRLLAADEKARAWDLADFVDVMLATGVRIGEAAALTWDAVDFGAGTVEVRGTVLRIKGAGLVIKLRPKTRAGHRRLALPSWAVAMLRRRAAESEPNEWGAVFTSSTGRLRDPSNTQADLRDVFARLGFGWITSHVFRKTAATVLDGAAMSARTIADQLGHAQVSITQDVYMGRKVASTDAARALEVLAENPVGGEHGG